MTMLTADSFTGVLVPMSRLNNVAALSGLRAAFIYAREPTYLLPRLSKKIADGVTSCWSGLL